MSLKSLPGVTDYSANVSLSCWQMI